MGGKPLEAGTVDDVRDAATARSSSSSRRASTPTNTTGQDDCPAALWDALDLEEIKKQHGAMSLQKNGPHLWMMDWQELKMGEKATFGGIEARWFELVDPESHAYVLQAREERFPIPSLAPLGDKLGLPDDWQYRTRILTTDLRLDLSPGETIYAVGDDFHQYCTRYKTA